MKAAIAGSIACAVFAAALGVAAMQDLPAPAPLAFTREPPELQWRIGFDLGNVTVLETPELNPRNDAQAAVAEAERILPQAFLPFGLALLPPSKVTFQSDRLVNPRDWTIVDLKGKSEHKRFQGLGVFLGTRMISMEGGFHLASVPSMPDSPFVGLRKEPAPENLIFGFAGPGKGTPQVHTRLSETKWENLLPVEDAATLPPGYAAAKELLGSTDDGAQQRFLYGTSIEAVAAGGSTKAWLLNYSHPDTAIGSHPWGIFIEQGRQLQPLYIYKPAAGSADAYVAYFAAAIDLNHDGADEFVIEASYRNATAFKVVSKTGGAYREILTSYFRGTL